MARRCGQYESVPHNSQAKTLAELTWTEQDFDTESFGVVAGLLGVFEQAYDHLRQVGEFAGIGQDLLPFQR